MKIAVLGTGATAFGEHWDKSLAELAGEAAGAALAEAGLEKIETCIAASLFGRLCASDVGAGALTLVSGDDACGASALIAGINTVLAGKGPVMVLGAEKASDYLSAKLTGMTSALVSEEEAFQGLTFTAAYGLMTRAYMERYGLSRQALSSIPRTAHRHAVSNPKAMMSFEIGRVEDSPLVADPLRVLDCFIAADGAAAIILAEAGEPDARGHVIAAAQGADEGGLAGRRDIAAMRSTERTAKRVLGGIGAPAVLELDDKFSILPIIAVEDMGLAERGKGAAFLENTRFNLSGGIKACGHAFGATGVRQVIDLLGALEEGETGLAHAVGGTGANSVVTVLSK
jgi:acetyl-CoA C-acetyltransferase